MAKAKIIAMANHKGGVGKTTTVASIGSILAKLGVRVLMIDLDSQCNLTDSFDIKEPGETIFDMFMARRGTEPSHISENLDIIPGDIDMSVLDIKIGQMVEREMILKDILQDINVDENYNMVLLDCPPSLGLVIINAFTAAEDIYVPITPEFYPTKGLVKMEEICRTVRRRLNPGIDIRGIILTKVNKTKGLHQDLTDQLRARYGSAVFDTYIRENVKLAECPIRKMDIVTYDAKCNGAADYLMLVREISAKLGWLQKNDENTEENEG